MSVAVSMCVCLCIAESCCRYGQTEEVYKEKVLDVCIKCAAEAKELKVKKWVEVSTAQVYGHASLLLSLLLLLVLICIAFAAQLCAQPEETVRRGCQTGALDQAGQVQA